MASGLIIARVLSTVIAGGSGNIGVSSIFDLGINYAVSRVEFVA